MRLFFFDSVFDNNNVCSFHPIFVYGPFVYYVWRCSCFVCRVIRIWVWVQDLGSGLGFVWIQGLGLGSGFGFRVEFGIRVCVWFQVLGLILILGFRLWVWVIF